jgi:hypothetical protein
MVPQLHPVDPDVPPLAKMKKVTIPIIYSSVILPMALGSYFSSQPCLLL